MDALTEGAGDDVELGLDALLLVGVLEHGAEIRRGLLRRGLAGDVDRAAEGLIGRSIHATHERGPRPFGLAVEVVARELHLHAVLPHREDVGAHRGRLRGSTFGRRAPNHLRAHGSRAREGQGAVAAGGFDGELEGARAQLGHFGVDDEARGPVPLDLRFHVREELRAREADLAAKGGEARGRVDRLEDEGELTCLVLALERHHGGDEGTEVGGDRVSDARARGEVDPESERVDLHQRLLQRALASDAVRELELVAVRLLERGAQLLAVELAVVRIAVGRTPVLQHCSRALPLAGRDELELVEVGEVALNGRLGRLRLSALVVRDGHVEAGGHASLEEPGGLGLSSNREIDGGWNRRRFGRTLRRTRSRRAPRTSRENDQRRDERERSNDLIPCHGRSSLSAPSECERQSPFAERGGLERNWTRVAPTTQPGIGSEAPRSGGRRVRGCSAG